MSDNGSNVEVQKNVAKGDWMSGFAYLCRAPLLIHSWNQIRRVFLAPIQYNKRLRDFLREERDG